MGARAASTPPPTAARRSLSPGWKRPSWLRARARRRAASASAGLGADRASEARLKSSAMASPVLKSSSMAAAK